MNDVLIETDDDNFLKFFLKKKIFFVREILNKEWVFMIFFLLLWPEAYLKNKIKQNNMVKKIKGNFLKLADNNPDVDAIYRLMNEKSKLNYRQ